MAFTWKPTKHGDAECSVAGCPAGRVATSAEDGSDPRCPLCPSLLTPLSETPPRRAAARQVEGYRNRIRGGVSGT